MLETGSPPDWALVDIAVPRPSIRLPGIAMAGFRHRATTHIDLAMVAHPSVTVLIDLSEGEGTVYDTRERHERGSVVVGLMPGDLRAGGQGAGECLQIRLEPVAAAAVLGGASAELSGGLAPLEQLWGQEARLAEERLRAASSWDERFAIAAALLARRLAARDAVDPAVAHVWRRLAGSRGRARVEGLADEVGWSRKRLWARFRAQLGIGPKRAARLVRFDHAAHLLASGRPAAEVAARSGYADQSHLSREARVFAGLTPAGVAVAPWLAIDEVAWPRLGGAAGSLGG
ncbi:AraC family transcriptional regulator [Nonomuraea soli]|uniref:AraC-like DNA-binding protein n=1 Tax=Nonomuraea soli TaxID=1032476 RepID=A0A7W0CSW3_9ACTN|nr:helix-turn-helix domain-containing protein [Nonomuraea soli]MBA2896721.1 AraC-like DNA-binding protein [Nonomuraea soli]